MKQNLTPRLNRIEPNIIIDGNMEIWPEGTSRTFANNTNGYGGVLFQLENTSTGVTLTNSQQASIPTGTSLGFSNQISKTAAGTLAAGTKATLAYYVEGYDIQKLFTTEFSIIFWVKSSVASNRSVSVKSAGSTHSYVQQYNIASAGVWQLVALRLPALSTSPATLNRTNGVGITINFNVVIGSTFQTSTLNAWQAGNFLAGNGEDTTWLTGTSHDFSIAGVMVLPGDWTILNTTTANFRFSRAARTFGEERVMAERYYEKSYNAGQTPADLPGAGSEPNTFRGYNGVATVTRGNAMFKVRKRTTPTTLFYSGTSSTSGNIDVNGAATNGAASVTTETGMWVESQNTFNGAYTFGFHWTADARF